MTALCVHFCLCVLVCVHVCACSIHAGSKDNRQCWSSLSTSFWTVFLIIYRCVYQASWPKSFWGFSWLQTPVQTHATPSSFMWFCGLEIRSFSLCSEYLPSQTSPQPLFFFFWPKQRPEGSEGVSWGKTLPGKMTGHTEQMLGVSQACWKNNEEQRVEQ